VALEGNLTDFSLADMFRLLETGSKTGTLHVTSSEADGVVCFREGVVYYANSGTPSEPAGKRLVKAGIISEKQLRQAQGLMKTNLVISEADAKEIQKENASSQILKKCRVIVVVSASLGGIEGRVPANLALLR